jgi:AcrR family transcriptional regulator
MAADPRPLRRDAERNRQLILEAARRLFAERGLDVSMDQIARSAAVGVGTVYRRFPDKAVLIDALFEDRLEALVDIARQALEREDPWEAVAWFMEQYVAQQVEDRGLRELLLSSPHGEKRSERARGRIKPIADELLRRAQDNGDLRPDVAGTDLALLQFMLAAVVDYTGEVDAHVWRRLLHIVLDGLASARDAPSPLPGAPLDDRAFAAVVKAWKGR